MSDAAAVWSGASYERIAQTFTPIHERLVEELRAGPGMRFLDVATGTGGVALPAARAGADVTGIDISSDQLAKARAAAAAEGLVIVFKEGDAEALPYEDESFDAVASAFGVIFAQDHARAAAELTRVCRRGGRLAITAWPKDEWHALNARVRPDYEQVTASQWADESYVRELLADFDLAFERGLWEGWQGSPGELWDTASSSMPPLKAWLGTLDPAAYEAARSEYTAFFEEHGGLARDYVLVTGVRR